MRKVLVWMLMLVLLVTSVVASSWWCYQETATIGNLCGAVGNGSYSNTTDWDNVSKVYDANWATSAGYVSASGEVYVNYTVPTSTTTAMLQYKVGTHDTTNITIPNDCIINKTSVMITLNSSNKASEKVNIFCANYTSTRYRINYTGTSSQVYEEGMWWNISAAINVELRNEQTDQPIVKNWTLEVWGDTFSTNFTIDGSSAVITNASLPAHYSFRYILDGYTTRYYYMLNPYQYNFEFYELNSSEAQTTLYSITDVTGGVKPGVTMVVYRKFLSSNQWEPVEMSVSDQNGQGILHLEPYDVSYWFSIFDSSGTLLFNSTTASTIPSTSIYFKTQDWTNPVGSYGLASNVQHSLTWTNASSNFTFIWNDPNSDVTSGSLIVTKITSLTTATICNSTSASAAATVKCNLTAYKNDTAQFVAQGWVVVGDTSFLVDTYTLKLDNTLTIGWGLQGVLYAFLIIATFAMFGIWNPVACMVFAFIGLLISVWFGLIPISFGYVAAIGAIIIIAILKVRT